MSDFNISIDDAKNLAAAAHRLPPGSSKYLQGSTVDELLADAELFGSQLATSVSEGSSLSHRGDPVRALATASNRDSRQAALDLLRGEKAAR